MFDPSHSFIELCLRDAVRLDEIDDYIDRWHDGAEDVSLQDYLGLSGEEYSIWLIRPDVLPTILDERRRLLTLRRQKA